MSQIKKSDRVIAIYFLTFITCVGFFAFLGIFNSNENNLT